MTIIVWKEREREISNEWIDYRPLEGMYSRYSRCNAGAPQRLSILTPRKSDKDRPTLRHNRRAAMDNDICHSTVQSCRD